MDLKELLEYCESIALAGKLSPTEDSVWRSICRSYSRKFSTPLHLVMEMEPEFVITQFYEDQFDDVDEEDQIEKIYDMILTLEDPEYAKQKQEELDSFIEQAELEEQERIKNNKPIHPALRGESQPNIPKLQEPPKPTSGSVSLSHLASEESENNFEE